MKLKNSFLIAAGVFFFAVAFINFAKAGDDGGENPDGPMPTQFDKTTVYDSVCVAYLWQRYDSYTSKMQYIVTETPSEPKLDYVCILTRFGVKNVCVQAEEDVCFPTKCSSYWELKAESEYF